MVRRTTGLLLAAVLSLGVVAPASLDYSGAAFAEDTSSIERQAFEAAKELGTVEAWDAFLANYPKGFHADLARAYVKKLAEKEPTGAPAAPSAPASATATPAPDSVTLGATAIRVGKWPERAAFDGRSLWVSESGARTIAEIDLSTRSVERRLKVGRLPVDVVATENGTVYALSETDNMIYAVAPREGKAGEYAEVPRCADLMAYADNNLWVVSNLNCSTPSVLTRVSHLNGRTTRIAELVGSTSDIKAAHGVVYIGLMSTGARPAFVSIVNAEAGNVTPSPDLPIHYPRLAANSNAVFIGGAPAEQNTGVVLKLAAGQAAISAQQQLPEAIAAIGATDQYVIAAGRQGTMFVLSANDLSLVRTIRTTASMEPHDVLAIGNSLAVVSSRGNEVASDNVVYLIDGWVPGSAAVPFVAPAAQKLPEPEEDAEPERKAELKCAKGYKKVRGECVMLQNCGANAYRSPEGDCYCNKNYDMKNGKCVKRQQKKQPVVDNCPGDSVLKNGRCVKEDEPDLKPPMKCTGGQLYSLSQQRCACQDGLKWNGQRCYLP